ncbi:nebulin [Tiliqua scincoides]|uniref:nebulin n=1 Tax=Tiliqua scincoides TaxID=71010 RepID=UPI0034635519
MFGKAVPSICPYYIISEVLSSTEQVITEYTETTYTTGSAPRTTVTTKHTLETTGGTQKASPPVRKKVVRTKVDSSKFATPYLQHSSKMQKLFSDKKYKEKYEKQKGKPSEITTDTPLFKRIKKAQDQLSEVKYRMAGDLAKTNCHVDEKARDIEHAKKVSQQVSKVLYKQNWEENKEKYLLPPDAPELVQAVKNTALYSKKRYIEDWESDKSLFYPYDDSPELRRVAQAQKSLSDIVYKKGHDERKAKYTALPDPPDVELAKKVTRQLSDINYHDDYNKKIKGKWSQTPCYDVAVAKMNADNISTRKYQEDWENQKDQIYFMQTETPEYAVNKKAGISASQVKYREDYEKSKASTDYNVLPATENPMLKHLKHVGSIVNDRLYKEAYEKAKGTSINYCDTPKYQIDSVMKNFSEVKYTEPYKTNILGRYVGTFEDPYQAHCMKVEAMKSGKNYKADYEEDKAKCYFPQTITQEYETIKKLDQCKDYTYKKHPDKIKFTQVTDSPVLLQAQINSKQLSDLNYKAKHEEEKFKCHIPPDAPLFLQSRVNAYNISDNWYKYDWEQDKAKKFEIKGDAISVLAAKAKQIIASDVEYKKAYEKSRGKLVGALSVEDDPKILHSLKVAKLQNDRLYKEAYEKAKGISINYCDTPKYQIDSVMKNFSEVKYTEPYKTNILGRYVGTFEDPYQAHCMKVEAMKSDKNYKADYEEDKAKCYFPQTITQEYEAIKKLDQCKDYTYKKHPDKIKFTQVTDSPVLLQAQINSKQLSDLNYKAKHEEEKFKCHIPSDAPQFLQSRVNAYNISDNWYKYDWEQEKAKKFEIKFDAIPIIAAKANRKIASDVKYKKGYEQSKGKLIGALSIEDDPKMIHSQKVAKQQSDREYRKGYEASKTRYTAPLDMIPVVQAKKTQAIVSDIDYRHIIHTYNYPPDSINVELAKKSYNIQSDNEYKADYNSWMKGCGWVPLGSLEVEKAKRASDILNERKYRQHPDTLKFTSIEDDPILVQAKVNQIQRSDVLYKAKNEDVIHKYHLPADAPQFLQAKVNSYNISDTYYKLGLEELKSKGCDVRYDAIPIQAAKSARHAASDFQYRKDFERAKGKMVGFQSIQDDPKLVHYMNVAKMQSDRLYRKDYEESKTKYNTPLDMVTVIAAKKAQEIASNTDYKHLVHHYTFLPDAMSVELSRNMMQIQSDNLYKSDFNSWMKGIGWIPIGSLDVEKVKKAGEALNEKKYRQHPDTIKFTSIVDSPVMVQAKQNAIQLSDKLYKSSGEEIKHKYHLPADAPQFIQAKYNATNISDTFYKLGYHELIAKGHNVLGDAIPITLAKASRNIASDYKYKEAYEKSRGKHVGFRSLQDDPKLVHSMNVAKMQSEREYRKDYEKSKTNYHTPLEMVSIQAAKQAQDVASNTNYKRLIHQYICLPDSIPVELARNRMLIQSDNVYKEDYNSWFKGIGWSPLGSLEVEKVKKAGEALNEKKYRQHPDTLKFTSLLDSMPMVLAQQNTKQLSDINYKLEGEKVKHKYHLDPDVPEFIQAKVNAYNLSNACYKADWKKLIAKGYDLKPDAIPIIAAKASRNIASDYKYKESYEKDKGKQVGFRSLQDDPKLVHCMNVAKLQSGREYKKDYEKSKTKYHTPLDMFSVIAAKKAQEVVTDMNYRQHLHNYSFLPDNMSVELSRNRMQIQSDNLYKTDFNNWMRGIGWVPIESLEVEKAKKATDILSEKKYRQHPDKLKYTIDMDAMEQVLAKQNAHTMNKRLYVDKWNKEKTVIHVMPDTPEILLSKVNQVTMSDKLYKSGWEEAKKKGYDLRTDAISIQAAKASRDIASDYKYKLAFEQAKGKHIGFRSLEDDPKLVHYMQVAKMQSEREYKKDYEKSKTRFHTPVDMFSVVAAKKAQEVATDVNYRNIIHTYNVLPDAMNLELAKNMMQIQSDNQYKADYDEYMKGVGWIPLGSLEAEKNKKAMEIVSEKKYRQHPDKLKYSILMDSMPMVLATSNAKIMDEHLYKKDWEADKTKIHITPDIPEILLAKVNAFNISNKMYKLSLEEAKKKGYDLRADAIPIQAAKASRDIASDYKYKLGYEKDKGKLVGFRSLQDDPKLVHYMQVAKMQSDREYKKDYETSKTRYSTPADTFSVMAAKEAQANITNTNYKRLIHKYILLPDAVNLELTRNMNRIQSQLEYKQDYNEWYKGLGWSPMGSLDVEKSKKSTEIASDTKYRQHPSLFPFKKQLDSMDMELAKHNAGVMNKHSYIEAWEKDKTKIHVMPDTPDIMQAKENKRNYSEKLYKLGWQEMLKKGYDLTNEAISVKTAKASRDIASDYKYKEGYRKQQGHHIGFRNVQDDPKLVHCMNVAKMQSEREYKKDFEKWKTKFNMPVDMLGFLLAKKCQSLVSDVDYRRIIHQWTCLPDQTDVVQAKKVYELQSDNAYKSDLEWLKGIGWNPYGSLESEKNRKASEILSEKKYRQHPDTIAFTSIADSMEVVLAKENAKHRSDKLYREAWDKDKTQIHIMPDTPEIVLSRANLINMSDKLYKLGFEELIKKGYDLPLDAIPVKTAKASRDIASEYKYKDGYRKQLGHHIGARSIQDDPKLVHSMNVAKMQSEREYKKDFEKWKTKYNTPVDMLGILLAKNCQKLVSDADYRHYLHQWTCLPDQNDVVHARKTYDLQSDNVYKADLEWLKGIGWSPSGSLEDEKNKRASQILSDYMYRQHPDKFKFTSPIDSMPMALAKHNSEVMNHRMYIDAWNKDKTNIHIMPDTPEILLSQQNKINYSEKLYKLALEESKKKGYDLRVDAIPIKAAKASRDIASEYKYKEGYRKQLGHHIGARSVQDDPKLVHSMNVAKMQSEREYKKDFEKWKTKYSSPVDMLGILLAKNCQKLVSDIDYRHYLHQWTCLPDQNDVIHAKKTYDLQSDNCYKSDLEWLKGIGWVPIGSLENEKVKRAGEILSEKHYRQPPDRFKFTSLTDSLEMELAKHNAETMNRRLYTEAWDKDKTTIHVMPDTPEIVLAKMNKLNYSQKLYRLAMEESKKEGYDLRVDAIPIQAAKASRNIASDYKYKEGYRKQLGHHVGARSVQDDPKIVHSMNVAKMQSEREYKKDFEKWKTKYSSPVDMLGVLLAKNCQKLVSDIDYRHYLHEWTCLPDQNDVIHARKAYDLQSDNCYKSDLEWLKGIGWVPIGSLENEKVKRAAEILSEKCYRQPPDRFKFTSVTDSLEMELAKHNAETMNKRLYTEAWDKDKTTIHVMPDTPEIMLAKMNKLNYSEKLYKLAMEEAKKEGYDLRVDAIPIQAAKASRNIASDYKYKEGYRKQLGHHVGARSVQDDPKIVHSMNVAKMQSEREYKKDFEKWKTKYSSPVDMLGILLAKNCQKLVSDIDYRHYLHEWTCLPDQNDVIHARKTYDLQSDNIYKSDLEWLKGIGWVPIGSLDVIKAKRAGEILSDNLYRQPPDKFKFTSITDSLEMELAKHNAETMNKRLYTGAWDIDKRTIHVMPDTPEILLAKANSANISRKLYTEGWEEAKKKGYDLRSDAISITSAKASRDIASDYKYKQAYENQRGHYIGYQSLQDDPRMVLAAHAAKLQSSREYRKEFEKWKTKIHSPVDMLSVLLAKNCQKLVSDVDYRHYLHEWTCLPDQNDVIQAKKAYELQSDNVYKSDLEWLRGIGWIPEGSLEVVKVKKAQEILNDRLYRQRPDTLKFTTIVDSPDIVLAKANALMQSGAIYREAWDKEKTQFTLPVDTPEMVLSKMNALNVSKKHYQLGWEEAKRKGHDLRLDAIEIQHAKASRNIASEYKYKEGYRRQLGHHIGALSVQDDPKLVLAMHVAKLQSDREYKKQFEKWKTKFNSPVDMLSILLAKNCQKLVSDIDYRHYLHEWTCLPDQNDVIQAKKAYDLQSDNLYKSDLEWLRGIGWMPEGSVDVMKVKKAQEILNDRLYKQRPDSLKFTCIVDPPPIVLAKINSQQISESLYREAWDKEKTQIHLPADTPVLLQSKINALNVSNKHYTAAWDEAKAKGYDITGDAISVKHAKASREIASEYMYKEAYEKQKGHYIGTPSVKEDPKLSWAAKVLKMQNDRLYKQAYNNSKAKITIPTDMVALQAAKQCQSLVSDIDYRHYLHQWSCLPDQNDVIQARKAYELQSDAVYKSDLEWLRGIGWIPNDSPIVKRVKFAQEILSDNAYRTPADKLKFTNIVDTPEIVLAKTNAEQISLPKYREAWDKDKTQIHVMPDTPEIMLSRANAVNVSNKLYKEAWDDIKKYIDLRADAIPILSAKASREIASDYKYKEAHEKQKGHYIGTLSVKEDPKLSWAAKVLKMQNDRLYKQAYNNSKAKITIPTDMVALQAAKQCQSLVSDIDYRHYLHQWSCLPDQNDVIQARKAYELQSDAVYKSDLEWLRGIGWIPNDSPIVKRVKFAQEILSDNAYRTPADKLKFTNIVDTPEIVLAKTNAEQISLPKYREAWDKDKTQIHVMPDTPEIMLSRANAVNVSNKLYKEAWDDIKKYIDLRADAIPILSAKASREIASDYKYKEAHEKQKGHYIGTLSVKEDPKLSWAAKVLKMQNDRLYKQAYNNSKAKITIPADMVALQAAKQCQSLVSDIDYRHYLHQWSCLPDQNDVIQARKAYELQSDAVYKSDLEWLRGIGWIPNDSPIVKRVKFAQEILSDNAYRTPADKLKFTNIVDTPEIVLAKTNAEQISLPKYREAWDKDKTQIHVMPDTPEIMLSRANAVNVSNKLYKEAWDDIKKYIDLRADAIPILSAKASREIASDYKYKEAHEKQKGHYIGTLSVKEDPKLSWAAKVLKMQNDRLYKQAYNNSKAKITIPADMVALQAAKQCQSLVSDIDYRHYLHQWSCLPDQNDVIQARKAYELQSDAVYKSDLEWLRGIGWIPNDSPIVKRVKFAQEILSDNAYRTPADKLKFTNIVDTPEIVLAKTNAEQISLPKYREAWDKDKTQIHVMPDTPEIMLSRANAVNVSNKLYKEAWDDIKKYIDLRADAIPILSAKASREIASDYKYKEGYRRQLGHHIGALSVRDDPKLVLAMHVAKLQSAREYKKQFEKWKTKFNSPVDMLSILLAKKCQKLVSDIDYRHYLHEWICLPDQNDVIQAKKAYDLQSDAVYKSDLEWLRGIGWMPNDSVIVNHVKHAQDILSERLYRTKVDSQAFTPVADRVDYITAKQGGEILSDIKYHQEWNSIKANYTLTKTPQLEAAKEAARILNQHLYKEHWEKEKPTGYLLPPDSVPFRHAKHSSDVQSELKYKSDYVKQRGHYVGVENMRQDPKLVWFEHAGKIQNDRLYKQAYHKTKSKIHIPPDMVSVVAARDCQFVVSEIPYRHYLHEWTCHPDQNDCIQAKKAYDLQSDNIYKSDLEWLRGCGWVPLDSVEHRKVKNAQNLINKRIYTKEAIDNFANFTPVEDPPDVVLAKANSIITSDLKYKETFNRERGHYIGSDDTPALSHSRDMAKLYSDYIYKDAWESGKAIGYTLPPDYIPIVGAKHADYVNSQLKYKETYEKQKGHYLAGKQINDFPGVVHSLAFQKIRSALAYRKNYEDTKAHIHIPSDMINHVLAKKCQYILSDLEYRTYLHQWNCSPEEHDVVLAKRAQEILSDVVYKDDLTWLKGIGCYVWDTPQILHAKKSYDLQSQLKYTKEGKDNLQNYGVVMDTPVYVTAIQSGINASDLKYKEHYHKTKDQYTTVLETVDHERTQKLKHLFSNNLYKEAWGKVKATGFTLPPDAVPLVRAKELKHNASIVKYREEYDKFKALYTLPRGVQDDPNTARCLRVGKLNLDRLYRETYEKNKAKIHIVPDMVGIVSAKSTQKKVSEIDYRIRLHEWANIADPHNNALVRKVTDQISDFVYKDDLNWLRGIGCFVWDTPEILHAKHAYDLRDDLKYKAAAEKMKSKYSVVMDTPLYVQNVLSGMNLSEAVYRHDYVHNIKGKYTPVEKTVDLERANNAYKIQCEGLYRKAGLHALPTGYKLPPDTPGFKHAKHAQHIGSDLKYKEVYEHIKGKGYNFGPKAVPFVNTRKVNKILNERLYRETYHKNKDKIHTTPDTPEIRQVKTNQESISDLIYKTDFFKMQGHMISLPYTPETVHNRYVGEITSDVKYKADLQWLRGLGCFLYDTPDMVRAKHLRKLWSHYVYTDSAKKMQDKYHVVLDTPVYRTVQELKTHLSDIVYRAEGKKQKTKYTSILDTPDFKRAKTGQKLQSKYLYVELATKERPHHHLGNKTPALTLARKMKDLVSEKKYKTQYEKMKHKYVTVPDTPILIRAKKAYLNASDLRYKETFEQAKGKYHTVKDALDIVYHRKVTDDISKVKYKEKYMSQLGIWRSIPDRPDHFHHRAVTDAVSDFKYKSDLTWLRGIGCYAWDTPDLVLAEKNKALYSPYKYKETFEKIKSKFQYVADTPINRRVKYATQLVNEKLYKSDYEKKKDKYSLVVDDPKTLLAKLGGELSSQKKYKSSAKLFLQHGCNEILRPDMLTALYNTNQWSQYKYKRLYEKQKDKFTSIVDTPEHLRTTKVNKQISDILYKMEYNKAKPKGYTAIHDTPMLLHVRKVKDRISDLKYKELYHQTKSHCNVVPDSVHIKSAKQAYKVNSNLDYKKKYEATKAHWHWTVDRPDFIQNAKTSLQQSDYEYKLDREYFRGCKLSVTDDKNTVLALKNAILASDLKYKEKHNKERGTIHPVPDTPQILLAKTVSALVSENKYKELVKKHLPHGSFTKLPQTRDTVHVKKVTKNVSETNYKKKFQKEKGKSDYSIMLEPPEVKHAMEVAKNQSNIQYKKDAKSNLHYTLVADRPDIKKATQVAKLVSDIQYKAKARGEAAVGVRMLGRPDIELAKEVSKLTSQLKYKEKFDKEKGNRPRYDLKESKIYKTLQDAHHIASEVKYKADLKKLHKPVTDMSESLAMHHVLNTSPLASSYQYKKQYEKSKGHYHVVPDNLEQIHLKEASELQSIVKYKEKYEKERGKPMLDFETPTYVTAKEAQHMQSEKEYKKDFEEYIKGRNLAGLEITPSLLHVKYATRIASEKEYRRDLEEGVKGKGLNILEETPELLRAKNATQILNEKEYKKALEIEIKGRGLTSLALETPDFMRAKNAMDIASQVKYKQSAEMEKANYTTVVDTPEIIHAHQVKNLASQKKYKEEAERTMSYYVPVFDTPEIHRVRENQKNFSMLQYQSDMQHSKGKVTVVNETPEILRVKENQKNFSTILYKEDIGTGTAIEKTPEMQRIKQTQDAISTIKYKEHIGKGTPIPDLPEVKRVKETQKHISSVLYKENAGQGTPIPVTPEIERVRRNQEHISSVSYKENLGTGTATPVTPEMERVKRNQENVSSVLYKETLGTGTPAPITPEMERVKRNQEHISSVLYKEELGKGIPTPVTPEMERVKRNQEHISSVLYKEELGKGIPTPVTPEMERVKRNQEHISSVLYKEELGKGIPTPVTPEMERVKRNQEHISSVLYKEGLGKGTPTPVTPEMERVKRNQEHISSVLYKEGLGKGTPTPVTPEMERVKRNQEHISSVLYKEGLGKGTPTPVTPEMERVKRNQEYISSVLYKENLGKATPTSVTPEMERAKRNQENVSLVLYKESLGKGTPTSITPEMERAKRNQENISSVLYSDSFRKQVQGKAAFVLDTPEMRRVRETQRHISTVKYHEDFEKSKGSFTPVVTDPITERVKKNMYDFSDINYRGIQRRVVEMERKRIDQDQEMNNLTGLRVWRTNPGSVFDYDPAEDNIQSRSLHLITVQAQRRSREQSRSASALSVSAGDEKSEHSEAADQHLSYYSNGGLFTTATAVGYKHAKTVELPQQRSSSVATQQTTVSSIPSHPSIAGKTYRAMYDYTAADADEVSFKDGDAIVNVQGIDEGWMYGTVQRTGKTGMLPANYVEAVM